MVEGDNPEKTKKAGVLEVLLQDRDNAKEAIDQLKKQLDDSDIEHAKKLKKIKELEDKIKELTEGVKQEKQEEEPPLEKKESPEKKWLYDKEL